MKRYYQIGKIKFSMVLPDEWKYEESEAISCFRIDEQSCHYEFFIKVTKKLSMPRGCKIAKYPNECIYSDGKCTVKYVGTVKELLKDAYLRIEKKNNIINVEILESKIKGEITRKIILTALEIERITVKHDGIVLHSAFVNHREEAILFTAPSGTGKTTQAELWRKYRNAEIINGDRTLIQLEKDGQLIGYGIPFSGSSEYCKNKSFPIKAIVYLEQAHENKVVKLCGKDAFVRIWEGCSVAAWNTTDTIKAYDIVSRIIEEVPVYCLKCTPDEAAVIALENELRKEW